VYTLIKKSKGLKANYIDQTKFDISSFKGDLAEKASKIIPKMFMGIQKARKDYEREIKNQPTEIQKAPPEFWIEIMAVSYTHLTQEELNNYMKMELF